MSSPPPPPPPEQATAAPSISREAQTSQDTHCRDRDAPSSPEGASPVSASRFGPMVDAGTSEALVKAAPSLALVPMGSLVPRPDLNLAPPRWLLRPSTELSVETSPREAALDIPYPMIKEIKSDFISDNELMRNLLSWQVSDRPVAIIVHRVGPTLILEDGRPVVEKSSLHAVMVSSIAMGGVKVESPPPSPTASSVRLKKNPKAQRQQQLLSKLQSQLHGLSAPWSQLHEWRHRNHSIVIASHVPVYRINDKPTSLYLCDADQPLSTSAVSRAFLDNVMAGIPSLTLAKHREGRLVGDFAQISTHEIPALATAPPLSVAEIEWNATALLTFLKSNCGPDLNSFLFLKPVGSKVAGLWRIDPANDDLMETRTRDRLLYNLSMLCTRASLTAPPLDCIRLLLHAVALLDQAAALGGDVRVIQRVSLCERLAELGLQQGSSDTLTDAFARIVQARSLLLNLSSEVAKPMDSRLCDIALRLKIAQSQQGMDDLKAIEMLSSALASFGSHDSFPRTYAAALAHIGDAMRRLAQRQSGPDEACCFARMALDKYKGASAAHSSKANLMGLGACYNELGQLLMSQGKTVEGLTEFERGCTVLSDAGDVDNLARVAANLAIGYRGLAQQPGADQVLVDGVEGVDHPPIVLASTGQILFTSKQSLLYSKSLAVLAKVKDLARRLKAPVPIIVASETCKTHLVWGFQLTGAARTLHREGSEEQAKRVAEWAYERLSQAVTDAPMNTPEYFSSHLQLGALEAWMIPGQAAPRAKVLGTLAERHFSVCVKGLPRTSPSFVDACVELAKLYMSQSKYEAAIDVLLDCPFDAKAEPLLRNALKEAKGQRRAVFGEALALESTGARWWAKAIELINFKG